MLKQILAALTAQSRSGIAAPSAEFWMKVKTRWRQNPGFVAAAAAGSIGLVLAVVLGIQGGLRLLDDPEPGDDVANDSSGTDLGDPDGVLSGGVRNDLRDLFDEPEAPTRAPRRAARGARSNDDLFVKLDDESETMSAPKAIATSGTSQQQKNPFESDGDSEAEEPPAKIKPRARHPLDDDPADEEEKPFRKTVQLPVEADDEMEADELEVEPAKIAAKSSVGKTPTLDSKPRPSLGEEEADEVDADASEAPAESGIAETHDKGTDDNEPTDAVWKNQRSKSPVAPEAPAVVAQKSRAVETVIYATPAAADDSGSDRAGHSTDEARPSRLLLEIAGPKSARVGQTCNFEIRVRNISKTTAEKVTLSVELPAALVHEVAQSLEQQVGALPPGKTYRALVRTQARAAGRATLKIDVAVQGQVETKTSATIDIGGGTKPGTPVSRRP